MPCLAPVSIPVYKLEPQFRVVNGKKSGGLMKVKHYIQVPCGKCPACLARQQAEWQFRIEQEVLDPRVCSALFVTLTYSPAFLPADKCVHKDDVQKYLKRLRVNLERSFGSEVRTRYYACGEYGDLRHRPHYHLILTFDRSVPWQIVQRSWSRGIVDIAPFTPARAGYVAKYSLKQYGLNYFGLQPPFRLCSKGLGKYFLIGRRPSSFGYDGRFRNLSGRLAPLSRYYRDKLFPHYKRTYSYVDDPAFGRVRVSHREDVSTKDRSLYLWFSQRRYEQFVSLGSSQHQDGLTGFLRQQDFARQNKLSFYDFSLIEKQILR